MKKIFLTIFTLWLTFSASAQDFTNFYTAYRVHLCIVTDDSLIYVGCSNAINIYHKNGSFKTAIGINGTVYSATRDLNGNLWFGDCVYNDDIIGGGLIKYDGYSWDFIPVNDSIVYSDIASITCDRNNNIWAAVNPSYGPDAAKICKYDGTQWNDYSIFGDTLYLNEVDKIVCDSNNVIYAGVKSDSVTSYNNVLTISETDTILYNYTNSAMTLACKHSSLVDRQNRVWFGGCFGHINSFENGVWTVHDNYSVFGNTSFTAIFQDNQNRMWLGTSNDIYIQNDTSWIKNDFLNEQDVIISDIKSDSDEHIWLAGYFDYEDIRGGCLIKQVADSFELMYPKSHIGYPREIAFNEDKIWLGKSYLSFFDGETWNNSFTANNISSEKTTSICTDSNGNLWYGTSTGLFKQTTEQAAEQILQLCGEDITGIQCIASYNNCLWIKTLERNLYKFDGTEWSKIDMTNAATSGFLKIVPRDENEIWITSTLGALKYDGTNWTIYTTDSGLMSNSVNDIAFQNDSVWIATIRGIALVYNQEVSILHNDSAFVTGFSRFNAIKVDKNGTKWAGCINGVLKFDDFSSEYLYPTGFEEEIYSITLDPNDNIWFCGRRAVSKYTFDNNGIENIRTKPKFLTFYPNPATNEFNFELPADIKNDILEIYSTNGAVIYQQKVQAGTNKIDIGNLPVGMYLVRIRGANLFGKFVKE